MRLNKKEIGLFEDAARNYIPLNFKGQNINSVITFIEILLKELKEQKKVSKDLIIKDILGR